ncbi:DUF3352 domain-containing protein [Aeromicrobium sp. Sec7.5]|uniref:DUF3352 domain-containing protein n=1 Tax=Aeromicrobium sp. Sec7.5 TaxID=3121276 RepID=UPI002FE4E2F4
MSTLPPPPGAPGPETSAGSGTLPPPPGGSDGATASGGPPRRSRRGLKIGIGVLALALVAGAAIGVVAYTKLSGGGPQPADVLPASTVAYVRLDLDPSASQKIALLDLINRVPEVRQELGLEDVDSQADLREVAFTDWFGLEDACGVDYEDDVKPWIGERVGLGLIGSFEITDDEDETERSIAENSVLVLQVTDEDKARAGITKLVEECGVLEDVAGELGDDLDEPGIAFRDGYALVTISPDSAEAVDAAAGEGTLGGDNEKFSDDMDTLGEDGVASVWYDQGALFEKAQEAIEELGDDAPADIEAFLEAYEILDTAAVTVRATDDSLEAAGVTTLTRDLDTPDEDGIAGLPEDTLIGASLVGGSQFADNIWSSILPLGELFFAFEAIDECFPGDEPDAVEPDASPVPEPELEPVDPTVPAPPEPVDPGTAIPEEEEDFQECTPPTFDDALEDFEDETGLTLPEDLGTLLGDELNIYVGSDGLDDLDRARDLDDLLDTVKAGIEITSDGDVVGVLESLVDYVGIDLDITETDDGAIIATNDDAAETLESDDGLSGSEAFGSVIGEHDRPLGGLFVDIGGVVEGLKAAGAPSDLTDDVSFLRAFGLAVWLEADDAVGFSAKLSFNPED